MNSKRRVSAQEQSAPRKATESLIERFLSVESTPDWAEAAGELHNVLVSSCVAALKKDHFESFKDDIEKLLTAGAISKGEAARLLRMCALLKRVEARHATRLADLQKKYKEDAERLLKRFQAMHTEIIAVYQREYEATRDEIAQIHMQIASSKEPSLLAATISSIVSHSVSNGALFKEKGLGRAGTIAAADAAGALAGATAGLSGTGGIIGFNPGTAAARAVISGVAASTAAAIDTADYGGDSGFVPDPGSYGQTGDTEGSGGGGTGGFHG
jgi:hypothetical protein